MAYFAKKIVLSVVALFFLISCSKTSDFNLSIPDFYSSTLVEKSSTVNEGDKKSKIHFYRFSKDQRAAFSGFLDKNKDAALFVQLHGVKNDNAGSTLDLGFFYQNDSDFSSLSKSPVVTSKFLTSGTSFDGPDAEKKNPLGSFALVFCVNRNREIPLGFFIKSSESFRIEGAGIVRACIGHDFSSNIPVFAFGPNGGKNFFDGNDDFTGGSQIFSSVNTNESVMPVFKIKFSEDKDSESSPKKIAFGGETLTFRPVPDGEEICSAALKSPFSPVTYSEDNAPEILMMMAGNNSLLEFSSSSRNPLVPIKTDPGLIMGWSRNVWRGNDYELFEWDRFPGVLIMDISTYAVQDDFLRRIAFFVEKSGYKGRLMSDEFLKNQHGYNAHDYRAESLADFFEKVRVENFPINAREKLLREILLKNGIIIEESDGKISAGNGAVISISQESPMYLRTTFIAHEGWHGIYFEDEDFRNAVASIYYTLDERTLAYLKKYFQVTPSLNYDVNDDYLMKNEFMAYMLQRPLSATEKYFVDMASREHSQKWAKNEADYVIETKAAGFVSAATLLDQYVNERWNLNAGRVWLISR